MAAVRRARTVDADIEAVWEIASDPHALPRWWPRTVAVEDVTTAAWTTVLRSPKGAEVRADFTRLASDPPRLRRWRQELVETPFERLLSEAVTEIELSPADNGTATRVKLTAVRRPRGLARFGGFMLRRAARRELDGALDGLEAIAPRR